MFSSEYPANIKADTTTGTLVLIDPSQQIHHCFGNDASTNILLASTQALNKDEVYQSPLTIIPLNSEKVEEKYSILVGQLEELGCYCSKLGKPTYQTIPDDWYEWREYIDTERFSISICCHNGTKFYQYLQSNGILDKYFPEEYKNWKFYK